MIVKLNLHGTEIVIDDLTTDEASALISNLIKNIDDNGSEQGEATLTVDESFDSGANLADSTSQYFGGSINTYEYDNIDYEPLFAPQSTDVSSVDTYEDFLNVCATSFTDTNTMKTNIHEVFGQDHLPGLEDAPW